MSTQDMVLVRKCIEGNQEALDSFVRRTRPAILRGAAVALRKFRVTDSETVDNVEQQVFLELLKDDRKTLRTFRGRSDLEGWVAVIAMRTAYRILRQRTRETALPDILPPSPVAAPGEHAERREFLNKLDAAFRKLSPEERALLRLAFYEKQTYKEISAALNMPLNSVSPKIIRARDRLRKFLE